MPPVRLPVTTMAKIEPFDEQAVEYDAWFDKHAELYQAELEALRTLVPAAGRGVEIGVGTGRFASPLGISIGVEPSPGMAELARQRGVEVLKGVAEALPCADNSFDHALMVTVVCFLNDIAKAFREAGRILKPGGTLVIGSSTVRASWVAAMSRRNKRAFFIATQIFIP